MTTPTPLAGAWTLDAAEQHPATMHARAMMTALGFDTATEAMTRTPARFIKALLELTAGINLDPARHFAVTFPPPSPDPGMVVVPGIPFVSMCVPSRQLVNAVGGVKHAYKISSGDQLWTLHEGRTVPTTVVGVTSHQVRDITEVETDAGIIRCTPDHPFATPTGWVEAQHLNEFSAIEWTPPRSLCRTRYTPAIGYDFGYAVGSICADGTVGKRWISLVVNDKDYALRFAASLERAFGVSPAVEPVTRPSGFTGRETPGFRVRVVSSYLADLMRMYVGGDAHHMRQHFPHVVLATEDTFAGFLDGYIDGDGYRPSSRGGRWHRIIVSGNYPFLTELKGIVGGNIQPLRSGAYSMQVPDSWLRKHGFPQEVHRTHLEESSWARVRRITRTDEAPSKPYTVYSFKCEPYPTFLIGGHLSHNCEHHLLPFTGTATVAYLPSGRIVGLSKLARVVQEYAARPQVQERLGDQITEAIGKNLDTLGAACVLRSVHSCMTLRGARATGAAMVTSHLTGRFRDDPAVRAELMQLAGAA